MPDGDLERARQLIGDAHDVLDSQRGNEPYMRRQALGLVGEGLKLIDSVLSEPGSSAAGSGQFAFGEDSLSVRADAQGSVGERQGRQPGSLGTDAAGAAVIEGLLAIDKALYAARLLAEGYGKPTTAANMLAASAHLVGIKGEVERLTAELALKQRELDAKHAVIEEKDRLLHASSENGIETHRELAVMRKRAEVAEAALKEAESELAELRPDVMSFQESLNDEMLAREAAEAALAVARNERDDSVANQIAAEARVGELTTALEGFRPIIQHALWGGSAPDALRNIDRQIARVLASDAGLSEPGGRDDSSADESSMPSREDVGNVPAQRSAAPGSLSPKVCGYGRYKDDPSYVGCPRARSDMTPCVARDGALAVADGGMCVGCDALPSVLYVELVSETGSAAAGDSDVADLLRDLVRVVTEP